MMAAALPRALCRLGRRCPAGLARPRPAWHGGARQERGGTGTSTDTKSAGRRWARPGGAALGFLGGEARRAAGGPGRAAVTSAPQPSPSLPGTTRRRTARMPLSSCWRKPRWGAERGGNGGRAVSAFCRRVGPEPRRGGPGWRVPPHRTTPYHTAPALPAAQRHEGRTGWSRAAAAPSAAPGAPGRQQEGRHLHLQPGNAPGRRAVGARNRCGAPTLSVFSRWQTWPSCRDSWTTWVGPAAVGFPSGGAETELSQGCVKQNARPRGRFPAGCWAPTSTTRIIPYSWRPQSLAQGEARKVLKTPRCDEPVGGVGVLQ